MSDYINIQFQRMPGRIHGACVKNEDGSFTVFLDPNDSPEIQRDSYIHEIEHIMNGDFDNISEKNVQRLEAYAHLRK